MSTDSTSEDSRPPSSDSLYKRWLAVLTGLGQIMFQGSALTGTFFLTGIVVVSPLMAAGALGGSLIGTIVAYVLNYERKEIHNGLYGYNSALVGIAMFAKYELQPYTVMLAIAGSIVATLLTFQMRRRLPVPTYTAPFIVVTWVGYYFATALGITAVAVPATSLDQPLDLTAAVVKGISEVMFQANVMTGALFIVGILLNSWRGAIWAMVGSLLGLLIGMSHSAPESNLSLGIYGYNAALVCMALTLYRPSYLLPIVGAIISVPFTEELPTVGLPTLTTPFVIASWVIIALDRLDARQNAANQPPSS